MAQLANYVAQSWIFQNMRATKHYGNVFTLR